MNLPTITTAVLTGLALCWSRGAAADEAQRPRARDIGLVVGVFPPGEINAITEPEERITFMADGLIVEGEAESAE